MTLKTPRLFAKIFPLLLLFTLIFASFQGAMAQQPDYGSILGAAAGGDELKPKTEDGAIAAYDRAAKNYVSGSTLEMTQQQVDVFQQKARRVFGAAGSYYTRLEETLRKASPNGEEGYFLGVLVFSVILIVIGRAGAVLYGLYIALPIMRRIQVPNPVGVVEKLPVLAAGVGLQIIGVMISLLIAAAVGAGFYQEDEATVKTVIAIAVAFSTLQMIDVLWRMVLSPFLPKYRIPVLSDMQAGRLYRWLRAGAYFGVISNFYVMWLSAIGADEEVVALTAIAGSLIAVLLIFGLIRQCGNAISTAILGGQTRKEATLLASFGSFIWKPVIIIYSLFAMVEMSYRLIMGLPPGIPLMAGLFGVVLAGIVAYAITIYVIERIFKRARAIREANQAAARAEYFESESMVTTRVRDALEPVDDDSEPDGGDGDGDENGGGGGAGPVRFAPQPAPHRRGLHSFEDLARRVASICAFGASIYATICIWLGVDSFNEGSYLNLAVDLLTVFLIGYIVFQAARIWMDRKIREESGDMEEPEEGDEGGAAAATRLATILPLFRSFVLLVILVASAFLMLMQLGVNIAPLLGGAGVVGLAIGFGAQSLVRDILSGVFFLSDDAFRKGEYISIGTVKGTVEKISVRSFQLRHHLGPLNTVPFGEIQHLTNYSRDWVIMKLPLRLTYDTDVDKVRKLIKNLGQELLNHPLEGKKFMQPLKSQGVIMMEDSAMIVRVKFMTKPGDQWTTRKLVFQEIRALFAREGIKFAHKEVTVRIPDLDKADGPLSEDDQRAIGAAARRAVEEENPTSTDIR